MEDHKDELILILAGYQREMEKFLQTNPGLRSRFPIHIDFPDYKKDELLLIAEQMCLKRQYRLTDEAKKQLIQVLAMPNVYSDDSFGNARTVRNLIEKGIRRQAVRLVCQEKITRDELVMIKAEDLAENKMEVKQ